MPTYHAQAIVLAKTKLADSDLIYTLLSDEGSQLRAVGKGARKPTSKLSGTMELFHTVDLLAYKGRSLDTVSDAKLVAANRAIVSDVRLVALASTVAELVAKLSRSGQIEPRIFEMTGSYLAALDADQRAPTLTVAALLKISAQIGFRPEFHSCVLCGSPVLAVGSYRDFSVNEGGVLCSDCAAQSQSQSLSAELLAELERLLYSTFEAIVPAALPPRQLFAFVAQWLECHLQLHLKSYRSLGEYFE
ncbi:MAG: DNA repair protein RecO [Coriobacteriales bacterium]|jgi:DNA repair protein RecO (recombination protein O)|nr:DNA repair protein RecO [Coriobacteriales bacterium]